MSNSKDKVQNHLSFFRDVMLSNFRLLVWCWFMMWGVFGFVFLGLWLWRYFY